MALINANEKVFPTAKHLLCRYHISNNVLAKCRKSFESKERWDNFISSWNILVLSSIEAEYSRQLKVLEANFDRHSQALDYIKDVWLNNIEKILFLNGQSQLCTLALLPQISINILQHLI